MRIVVTGASGNIGTALLRRLSNSAADGDSPHDVVGVSRRDPGDGEPYGSARWEIVDLGSDAAATRLIDVFADADAVVHLAWLIQPSHNRDLMRRTNQSGTRAVVQAAVTAGVAHLVHMSSLGAYAPAGDGVWADESWPTTGVPTSAYSVDKSAAERIVGAGTADSATTVSVVRPSLVLQPDAASEISRYFLGRLVPASLVRPGVMKLAPWPSRLTVQLVHADDVAEAIVRIVEQGAAGAFNLAAPPVLDRAVLRRAFGGLGPPAPLPALRVLAELTWRARLQPTDAGWLDLGAAVPLLRTDRAGQVLGWAATHRADDLLREFLAAMGERRGSAGPLLERRLV